MEIKHVSEEAIQAYAIAPAESAESIVDHINSCRTCGDQVIAYRRILGEVKALPAPTFDESAVAAFVQARLTSGVKQRSWQLPVLFAVIPGISFFVFIFLLWKRPYFISIFLPELRPLFSLILACATLIIIFHVPDYIRRYQALKKTFSNF